MSQVWLRESGERRDAEPSRRTAPLYSSAPAESGSGSDEEAAASGPKRWTDAASLETLMGGLHTSEAEAAAAVRLAGGPPA